MQMLTQAMNLFFPVHGAGPGGGGPGGSPGGAPAQLLGTCGCRGILQVTTDATFEPPRQEIKCSAAAVGGCTAGLGPMPITATIRELTVRIQHVQSVQSKFTEPGRDVMCSSIVPVL
jgi:hypothetical protein